MWVFALVAILLAPDDKEAEDAIQRFKAAMKSVDIAARTVAVGELGRVQHEKTMKILGTYLITDERNVRIACAKSLGTFQDKKSKVVSILAEAIGSNAKEPDVLIAIFAALRDLRDPAGLGVAYRYLEDKNGRVAEAAVAVTGTIRSRESIDPLIKLLKRLVGAGDGVYGGGSGGYDVPPDEAMKERARLLDSAANKALTAITGERCSTPREWENWWRKNSGTFKVRE